VIYIDNMKPNIQGGTMGWACS